MMNQILYVPSRAALKPGHFVSYTKLSSFKELVMTFSVSVNPNIIEMEYAVRGPIPMRAAELAKQGKKTISCNIGNPQALGQKPISFYRQILSLLESPDRIERERKLNDLAKKGNLEELDDWACDYTLDLAEDMLSKLGTGMGAYTESKGPLFIRKAVAAYIDERDGPKPALRSDPESIFLTNGASEAVKPIIDLLIANKNNGIMVPIPQYPLYSAILKKVAGAQVNYYPDEDQGWTLSRKELKRSYDEAKGRGIRVKGIVVINPGNPTGAILPEQSLKDVIAFAQERNLVIIADEVYQHNIYGQEFVSFAKALGDQEVPVFSLHSTSKGFYGECGHRGGYVEVRNAPAIEGSNFNFLDLLLKQASVSLCSNTIGQALTFLTVSQPRPGSTPYDRFVKERDDILSRLHSKAKMIRAAFSEMTGVECFGRTGAMYLFPRLNLPPGKSDFDYCMALLEKTGLCTVNGSGFGQKEGTQHLRIAFLPPKALLDTVMPAWIQFHNQYVNA
jgi:aspartate/methionine/tyrosine aminotransferase